LLNREITGRYTVPGSYYIDLNMVVTYSLIVILIHQYSLKEKKHKQEYAGKKYYGVRKGLKKECYH